MNLKFKKIEISKYTNLILACLLTYFLFFGYICNIYKKSVGLKLIFLNRVLINPNTSLSIFILMGIVSILNLREHFFEYGIRYSIWLTPFIILISWIWYWFLYGFDITIIGLFFISLEGYITLLLVLGINIITAIIISFLKITYKTYIKEEL